MATPKPCVNNFKSEKYREIISAADSGQLWSPSGHFYPNCSASPLELKENKRTFTNSKKQVE